MSSINPVEAIAILLTLFAGIVWLSVGREAGKAHSGKGNRLNLMLWGAGYLTGAAILVGLFSTTL